MVGYIQTLTPAPYYEDESSLKQWINKQNIYNREQTRLFRTFAEQAGTGSEVEVASKDSVAITQMSKTETNLQVISSAADAGLEHSVITAHYLDQDGVAHTATIADASADMSGATDFDTPVTDFYCWDIAGYGVNCFTSSLAVGAGKTLSAGAAGTGYAEIAAAGTAGTKLKYFGVGTVYGRAQANHADGVGAVLRASWTNPWGDAPKSGSCTLGANSTDEVVLIDADGFPSQDCYGIRQFGSSKIATSNSGNFLLTDSNCANVDGSGNDVWAVVAEGAYCSVHTRYYVPADGAVWMSKLHVLHTVGTNVVCYALLSFTPLDCSAQEITLDVPNNQSTDLIQQPIALEPLTFVTLEIKGNLGQFNFEIDYIEAVSAA